ncbi:MAG: Rpn family recombination-promoting nuclease/putative transposase [Holosporaceae bacterium]|jgi:predicted transposase/invertase (TIGR01784 family)|nr:Rpn family recombination-promoting nuclease/putative transposase [Holosporaceae bacterium]
MHRFLNPRNDFAFKQLFGTEKNKDILIQFLNDIFEGQHDRIEDVEFLKTNLDPEVALLRQSIVDVLCKDTNGNHFIIEMQYASDSHFIQRAVAYACRAYLNQRTQDEDSRNHTHLKKKVNYGNMSPVIFFSVIEKTLFKNKKEYLSHHKVTDVCTGEVDIDKLSFSFLELSKFRKESIDELETNIEKWAYFFKNAELLSQYEAKEIEKNDQQFWKVYTALAEYNYSPEELLDYERYEMKQDEIDTIKCDAQKKGKAEGIAIGEERGKVEGALKAKTETALNALAMGLSIEQISKLTGLSEDEIKKLR